MTATIIDGRMLAKNIRQDLKEEIIRLKAKGVTPGLAVIIVGHDPASVTYVKAKAKACQEIGIYSDIFWMAEETTEAELLKQINDLNENPNIHGILVQLPLPPHISEQAVINTIAPEKDVDGFHPVNAGKLMIGAEGFIPCTPHGIIKMIQSTGETIAGKHAVVIGRSNIVGKPMATLLLREHATVTICHSRTKDLSKITKQADILVVACGCPGVIGREHVAEGAIVIDVGVNRKPEGQLVGDVRFDEVKEKAAYLTPVPGGVGPMTITMLLYNTVQAAKQAVQQEASYKC
ncbi:bifunctional methylenetetrahydrofolate dehydrogenase/methenyltetrahydrofolate cyclohydrolase FolD [Caldalkalibacillus thermarum TA2.A1]|uniref:Bifunctional protein FolD n=1 Tax=Caldalkalibacillus thermarum (strain TA2.A1) TaxID=986075 RepID=A0A8X8I1T0_CALTT|nr:bifunctional methylenetetrahydrofolate dehydrogenase/methenyltetrahydrofolate cyclohydrolase FolD [Caldalkalibacillus thermarum]QZT32655.1 bifunctional methylenetetrahydrofolate dehydrogenase/methenyltetrahydrofolate cyclohydrolase FolD [Caldalkalibacillus thermarum TA2.A1]